MAAANAKTQQLFEMIERLRVRLPSLDGEAVQTAAAAFEFAIRCQAALEAHIARYGLSPSRLSILMLLHIYPERAWTPALLAEAIRVTRPTVTGILKVLERERWIERVPDRNDARQSFVAMSQQGKRRFEKIVPEHFARIAQVFTSLSPRKHARIRQELGDLLSAIEAMSAAPGGRVRRGDELRSSRR